jgi:hypothetical protein
MIRANLQATRPGGPHQKQRVPTVVALLGLVWCLYVGFVVFVLLIRNDFPMCIAFEGAAHLSIAFACAVSAEAHSVVTRRVDL